MPLPIVRRTGIELLDLFQRSVVDFLKELSTIFGRGRAGQVPPAPPGNQSLRFLCEDGEWRVP